MVELGELEQARFVDRPNRFAAVVERLGTRVLAHVPNSGRMSELLVPSAKVFITPAAGVSTRKTRYDLTLVEHRGRLVSVDSRLRRGCWWRGSNEAAWWSSRATTGWTRRSGSATAG